MRDESILSPSPPPPSPPSATSPNPTWKFRRSSSTSNQLQLPDIPTVADSSDSTPQVSTVEFVDPVTREVAPSLDQNTTIPEGAEKEPQIPPSSPPKSDGLGQQQKAPQVSAAVENEEPSPQTAAIAGPDSLGNKAAGSESKKEEDAAVGAASAQKPLQLPPATAAPPTDHHASKPALFGFFERDKSESTREEASTQNHGSKDNDNAVSDETEANAPVPSENATNSQAWYPMLDSNDYDFRDRRLDY